MSDDNKNTFAHRIEEQTSRRTFIANLGAATALIIPHFSLGQDTQGNSEPKVWLDMTQSELDAAYSQRVYAPNTDMVLKRISLQSAAARARLGEPRIFKYGNADIENLHVYRSKHRNAPVHVFIHGGAWRVGSASGGAARAEPVVNAGGHSVLLNFSSVGDQGARLSDLARQVRDAVAWVYRNAARFDGDPERIYVAGHSSGGHLTGVVLTTDWARDYDLPPDVVKGGLCSSGIFDLKPVRLSHRNSYLQLTDEEEELLSPQRHIGNLNAPVIIAYGTEETPEFQRQSRDFHAAVQAAGNPQA